MNNVDSRSKENDPSCAVHTYIVLILKGVYNIIPHRNMPEKGKNACKETWTTPAIYVRLYRYMNRIWEGKSIHNLAAGLGRAAFSDALDAEAKML
jgi:hypothetical protein